MSTSISAGIHDLPCFTAVQVFTAVYTCMTCQNKAGRAGIHGLPCFTAPIASTVPNQYNS